MIIITSMCISNVYYGLNKAKAKDWKLDRKGRT